MTGRCCSWRQERLAAAAAAAQREEEERIAAEKKAAEERIAAEKKAEEERIAAEKKVEEEEHLAAAAAAAQREEEEGIAAEKEAGEEEGAAAVAAERLVGGPIRRRRALLSRIFSTFFGLLLEPGSLVVPTGSANPSVDRILRPMPRVLETRCCSCGPKKNIRALPLLASFSLILLRCTRASLSRLSLSFSDLSACRAFSLAS